MRILQVVVRFHPYVGGVENTVYHLARRLAARGHEVRVVCADEPAGSPPEVEGIAVVRLPWWFKVGNANVCFGIRDALLREKPDLIHAHLPTAGFPDVAASVSRKLGVPLVLTYNNDLIGGGLKGVLAGIYNRFLLPRLFAACDRIVYTNPLYPSQSPYLDPGDPKLFYIPWGVEVEAFQPAAEPPSPPPLVVGFLSLLDVHHRYKGLEVLLRALAEMAELKGDPPVRLRVGGAGAELGWYRQRAEELGVADRVEFLGFVQDLNAFYGSCHVFALPSTDGRQEGFGLVLLEAMACGRPVVTTPIVGVAGDVEPRGVGVLVSPGDPVALANALRTFWQKRADLPAMGRQARELVEERYGWERITEEYERLFLSLPTRQG
ncbi:MAG TPA: glycosyltransferase family 4 protein [Thermoanaerobaculia bacterium]|nr:glycosyltransferase family 4 protein [Thermoanaerobaculia bacterium]